MHKQIVVRRGGRIEEISGMLRVENEAWPEKMAFTKEHFLSHLVVFPEGIFIAKVDGEIAGVGISEIIQYDLDHPVPTWYEVTDNGFLRNKHDPAGNTLYGVSLTVSPRFSAWGIGPKMLDCAQRYVVEKKLERFVIGSRVPRYHKYAARMTANDYIHAKKGKRYFDPEVEFYASSGFIVVGLLPEYFEDPDSVNYGVLMSWDNPNLVAKAA